jgi:hypothetical protein
MITPRIPSTSVKKFWFAIGLLDLYIRAHLYVRACQSMCQRQPILRLFLIYRETTDQRH